MSCKSICKKNKTEKGYLCDKVETATIFSNGKKWCKINNEDVEAYKQYLETPKKYPDTFKIVLIN